MKKGLRHIVTSWVAVVSFSIYSIVVPSMAYADDTPAPSTPPIILSSCEIIGLSEIALNTPQLQLGDAGSIYDVGCRYKIFAPTTSQQ